MLWAETPTNPLLRVADLTALGRLAAAADAPMIVDNTVATPMLVRPIDLKNNKVLMENMTDEDGAYYILHEIHEGATGQLQLRRTIWFNRLDLLLARQLIFDDAGNILTDVRYSEWKPWDNVPFPKHIDFNRPHDEIGLVLDVVKMDINKGVSDDKFVLEQPEGTKLQTVGQPPAGPPGPGK